MSFCKECGTALGENAHFCESCGAPVANGASVAQKADQPALERGTCLGAAHAREVCRSAPIEPGEFAAASWTETAPAAQDAIQTAKRAADAAADAVEEAAAAQAGKKAGADADAGAAPKKKGKLLLIVVIVAFVLVGGYAFLALWPGLHTNTPSGEFASVSDVQPESSASLASASPASANYSTSEEPSFSDFDWYLQLPRLDRTPSDGTQIKNFDSICGGWKCMFVYDSMGEADGVSREILNVYINGSEGNFSVVLDLCKIEFGREIVDETGADDIVLNGTWDGSQGTLTGTGSCKFEISTFYSKGNSQYALGRMGNASGEGATVLMVRP